MSTTFASVGSGPGRGSPGWSRLLLALGAAVALAGGSGIYLVFRPEGVVGLMSVGLGDGAIRARGGALSVFLVYSFPGLLWVFSATLGQAAIWVGQRSRSSRIWLATPLVVGCVWEFGQVAGLLRGTADLADVLACVMGSGLGLGAAVLCDSDRI